MAEYTNPLRDWLLWGSVTVIAVAAAALLIWIAVDWFRCRKQDQAEAAKAGAQ